MDLSEKITRDVGAETRETRVRMPRQQHDGLLRTASRALATLAAIVVLSACVSPPQTPTDFTFDRERLGRIAVVAHRFPPSITPVAYPVGAVAAGSFAALFARCAAGGGPQALVFCATLAVPVAGLTTAIAHGSAAPPAGSLARADARLRESVAALDAQTRLRHEVTLQAARSGHGVTEIADEGPSNPGQDWNYRALTARGFDTVLQLGITDVSSSTSLHGHVSLLITARARLIDLRADRVLLHAQYRYRSEPRTVTEWLRFDGKAIGNALGEANRILGDRILDETLRVLPIADPSPARADSTTNPAPGTVAFRGLRPISPPWPRPKFWPPGKREETVDSPQPLLRWETFPREIDRSRDNTGLLTRVSDVRYDLRLASPNEFIASPYHYFRLIESADGLRAGEYRVQQLLEPQTHYLWTVRARFYLDGRERVTPWGRVAGGLNCPGPGEATLPVNQPNECSYRFTTGRWLTTPARSPTP